MEDDGSLGLKRYQRREFEGECGLFDVQYGYERGRVGMGYGLCKDGLLFLLYEFRNGGSFVLVT